MPGPGAIRLVVFDCDGTLVDSQFLIARAMAEVWHKDVGAPPPPLSAVRQVVGLSLEKAIATLLPGTSVARSRTLARHYREAFRSLRAQNLFEPTFPGVRATLESLERRGVLSAVATGKSRRGLIGVLRHHGLLRYFLSLQTADDAPSKPHPRMVQQAMSDAGVEPAETVVVGDTTFDVEMAGAAGAQAIGVSWGYHPPEALHRAGARVVLESFQELPRQLDALGS